MKHLMFAVVGLTLVSSPAFAAKHCVDKDKHEISVSGTSKARASQCKAAGGKWVTAKKASTTK
jgi:methylmalonyl-CoA mutase cobalamin-binding subunit